MTAFTTQRTGNWSVLSGTASSPWYDNSTQSALNTIPGNGDTIEVATGHTLTQDADYTIGTSPATAGTFGAARNFTTSPAAIKITGTGAFVQASGVTLTCRGDIDGPATLRSITMNNSRIILDSSQASDPPNTRYYINDFKLTATGTDPTWNADGSWNATFCEINGNGGGTAANGRMYAADASGSTFLAVDGLRIKNVGIAGDTQGIYIRAGSQHFSAQHVLFDGCGALYFGTTVSTGAADVVFRYVTFRNPLSSTYDIGNLSCDTPTTGQRVFYRVVHSKQIGWSSAKGLTPEECVCLGFWAGMDTTGTCRFAEIKKCIFYSDIADDYTLPTPWLHDCYLIDNGHGHTMSTDKFLSEQQIVEYCIFDSSTTIAGSREHILFRNKSGQSGIIRYCISTKNAGGQASGVLGTTYLADANASWALSHNSGWVDNTDNALLWVGRVDTGHANEITAFDDNITKAISGTAYHIRDADTDNSVTDLIASSATHNNVRSGLAAGSNGNGYDRLELSSGTIGASDINADPQWFDGNRNLATWDTSLGGAGTHANALAKLARINDSNWDKNYNISDLLYHVRTGFVVTNTALYGAASDGLIPGAVQQPVTIPALRRRSQRSNRTLLRM